MCTHIIIYCCFNILKLWFERKTQPRTKLINNYPNYYLMSVRRSSGGKKSKSIRSKTSSRTSKSLTTDREAQYNDDIDYINNQLWTARNTDDAYQELQLMIDLENTYIKRNNYQKRQLRRHPSNSMSETIKAGLDEDNKKRRESIKEIKQHLANL